MIDLVETRATSRYVAAEILNHQAIFSEGRALDLANQMGRIGQMMQRPMQSRKFEVALTDMINDKIGQPQRKLSKSEQMLKDSISSLRNEFSDVALNRSALKGVTALGIVQSITADQYIENFKNAKFVNKQTPEVDGFNVVNTRNLDPITFTILQVHATAIANEMKRNGQSEIPNHGEVILNTLQSIGKTMQSVGAVDKEIYLKDINIRKQKLGLPPDHQVSFTDLVLSTVKVAKQAAGLVKDQLNALLDKKQGHPLIIEGTPKEESKNSKQPLLNTGTENIQTSKKLTL